MNKHWKKWAFWGVTFTFIIGLFLKICSYYFFIGVWGGIGSSTREHCLEDKSYVYLTIQNHAKEKVIERGALYTVQVFGIPFFRDGQYLIKHIVGLPNDTVQITDKEEIIINGNVVGNGLYYVHKANMNIEKFTFSGKIPQGKYFVLGNTKYSYDSRYWGLIDENQIIGRTYSLLSW